MVLHIGRAILLDTRSGSEHLGPPMLLVEFVTDCSGSLDNVDTSGRIGMAANRNGIVFDRQMNITAIDSRHRLRKKLLLDMFFNVLKLPRSCLLSTL